MSGAIPFATDAWIKRLADECNQSQTYREAAKDWEGDVYFVVESEGRWRETVYMYMDLYHGECRQAFVQADPLALSPEFWISGPVSAWREIAEQHIDPLRALLIRRVSLKGSMSKMIRHAKAAQALMRCAANFETEFPG
jgi:putative sterol carrier protein